jgi:hypothetical protein
MIIAAQNKRSINKKVEFVIGRYVADYEKKHGYIKVDELPLPDVKIQYLPYYCLNPVPFARVHAIHQQLNRLG